MRKTLNNSQFWMLMLAAIIVSFLLFAGDGNCGEIRGKHVPGIQYIVHEIKVFEAAGAGIGVGTLGYSLSGKRFRIRYEHYIKPLGRPAILCLVTNNPPTMGTLIRSLRRFQELKGGTSG